MPPFRYFAVSLYAAGVLCVTTTAFAAQPQPVYNWTGWYIGLNAGGNWGSSKTSTTFDPGPNQFPIIISYDATALATINPVGAPSRFDTSGFTGGIHGGYNWQSGNFLAGGRNRFRLLPKRRLANENGAVCCRRQRLHYLLAQHRLAVYRATAPWLRL